MNALRNARVQRFAASAGLAAIVGAGLLASCTAKSSESTIGVTSTADSCLLSDATTASGPTTFEVTNDGGDVTEVYVYAEGSRVMGEVENIGPGSKRSFTVALGGGTYEVACKPGQKGDGIRSELIVTGATSTTEAPSRTVQITANEWGYTGLDFLVAKEGESIKFVLTNDGTVDHEMEILDPDGESVGEVGPTKPGEHGEVVIKFHERGEWTVQCGIEGHLEHGMRRNLDVV